MTQDLTRRRLLIYGGGVALAALVPATRPDSARADDPAVPTFASVYGRPLGQSQATSGELDDYVQRLARASPRVRTELLDGTSVLGRPLRVAFVSSPANLARQDEIEARTRALRLKPPSAAVRAREVAALPALVNVLANVHGNEPSGADGAARLLYELAARTDAANQKRLDELIIAVVCVQNPDGRESEHRVNANGFDLNRDWFAFTQPETPGKLALYSRRPPILGIDMHEQFASPPDTFFFPPDNDPAHHESSRAGLAAVSEVFTPAMEKAFSEQGYSYEHYGPYDVFYPGYGDIAPNQIWGAAGVLFEQENADVYPMKVLRQFTALDAAVSAAATHRETLLAAWAAQWPEAAAQGRRGELAPNIRVNKENAEPAAVPDEKIYGYAFSTTRHAADVAHLVDRLRRFDVEVHVTTRPVTLAVRRFGGRGFAKTALGRGSIVVSTAQPMKHWVHILLADDPFPSVNAFYDVSGWSNPAMMGLAGGAIGEPIAGLLKRPRRRHDRHGRPVGPQRHATIRAVDSAAGLQGKLGTGTAYAFALDAALAQAAAFALMAQGVTVLRSEAAGAGAAARAAGDDAGAPALQGAAAGAGGRPTGSAAGAAGAPALRGTAAGTAGLPAGFAVVDGAARGALLEAAKRYGIRPRALSALPDGLVAARRPRCQVLHDAGGDASEVLFATSNGFATWLVRDRFGLPTTRVTPADIEGGSLGQADVLIVPDGFSTVIPGTYVPGGSPNVSASAPGGGFSPAGLAAIRAFVERGGTFVGYRTLGVSVAMGAGIAGTLATRMPPSGFVVPGLPIRIELTGEDLLTRGLGQDAYCFTVADPILTGGGTTLARYPDAAGFRALGYASGLEALHGTVAATTVAVGQGRAYAMSFDPAYRGYVEGTQRMLGNVLLTAPTAAPVARAASSEPSGSGAGGRAVGAGAGAAGGRAARAGVGRAGDRAVRAAVGRAGDRAVDDGTAGGRGVGFGGTASPGAVLGDGPPVLTATRPQLVRVAARDAAALRRAVAATDGIPGAAALEVLRDGALQLCAPDPDPLSGHTAPWVGRLLVALRGAGVHPELVVA